MGGFKCDAGHGQPLYRIKTRSTVTQRLADSCDELLASSLRVPMRAIIAPATLLIRRTRTRLQLLASFLALLLSNGLILRGGDRERRRRLWHVRFHGYVVRLLIQVDTLGVLNYDCSVGLLILHTSISFSGWESSSHAKDINDDDDDDDDATYSTATRVRDLSWLGTLNFVEN